ncbi:MAG TPA: alginate lyase family protein [Burkholderiaceae bacterium]|nr:alginate lyase family protein [Burkholderiaceae bacterium]
MSRLGRLWRTLRWLKAGQIVGRLRFRLARPRPDLRPPPPLRAAAGSWITPPAREASLLGPTRMRFLGEEHDLDDVGWDDASLPLLWRYNQHYFDDLNAIDAGSRRAWQRELIERWLADNPPGRGTAWAPYPTSLRIVNAVKCHLGGQAAAPAWLHSLAIQARWLTQRLEWHLLGNHLFVNAKALVFAGLLFDGAEAEGWLAEGLRILERELQEQILADGAQFERSPMYHALALEDVLDLVNLIEARAPRASPAQPMLPRLRDRAQAMLTWLRCMRHPGGALARFNDGAEGIAPATDAILRYAADLGVAAGDGPGEGVHALQPSGYVRVERGPAIAFLDLAPIGPDYLPGHAHADTLSFELSVRGREVVVNRGTSVYGTGARRQVERGTAAHSTVQIGAHDSSEVWAGFRVGRRARPGPVRVEGWRIDGSHDGYAHLRGGPIHHRRWTFDADALVVEDRIEPPAHESAIARFHLAPGLSLTRAGAAWRIGAADAEIARIEVLTGTAETSTTLHAMRFGVLAPAATLSVRLDAGRCAVRIHW